MKNKKILILISAVILLVSGCSASIGGYSFSTKYYNDTVEAYNSENTEYVLKNEIASVVINNLTVILGETQDNKYIITPFKTKNNKFYSLSHVDEIFDFEEITQDIGESFYRIDGEKIYYNLIVVDEIEQYKNEYSNIRFSEYIRINNCKTLVLVVYYK